MLVATFWENPLQVLWGIGGVCHAGVLVVSQLCFGGRWCLVAFWWCVRGCLGVFGDVFRYVLLISWWCFCGVSALLRGVFGGIEGMAFSWLSWITSQDNIVAKGNAKLCYWGSMPA